MSKSVSLSDEIVLDARLPAEAAGRSIDEQIELWAKMVRAIEPFIGGARALELQTAGAVRKVSACTETVDSEEGRQRVAAYLQSKPFPH